MTDESPRFVRLNPAFDPLARQEERPNEFRVAFRDGQYEVFYAPAEPQRYRVLRLDANAPRARNCRAEISLSYRRGPRMQFANMFVDVSAIGGFSVGGLDEQLLHCVAQMYGQQPRTVSYDSPAPFVGGTVKVTGYENPHTEQSPALPFPQSMALISKLELLFNEKRFLGQVPR